MLRIELRTRVDTLQPADNALVPLVFDGLVRAGEHGEPLPSLAVSWRTEGDSRRWQFRIRPGVRFHDGTPLTASAAAASLEALGASAQGDSVVIVCERPSPQFPLQLVRGRTAIARRTPGGAVVGTGPFRVTQFEPGQRAVLTANDDYWRGRPFLDGIRVEMGRATRDQLLDLELDRADIVELGPAEVRRASQGGRRVWTSQPVELMALRLNVEDSLVRETLALSIDRAAIHGVLLQKQGAPAASLLPQWLSGYAFLFNPVRRRTPVSGSSPIGLYVDTSDPLATAVASRIAVNAREAGIVIRIQPAAAGASASLVRVRMASLDPLEALPEIGAALGLAPFARPLNLEELYRAERTVLDDHRVVPLFHLPDSAGLSAHVRNWQPLPWGGWPLDNVWLAAR
ncbi:MAG: ABC transporter substrate-binding protein [Bryobacteraceae bacterium]